MSSETKTINETKLRADLKKVCNLAYKKGLLSGFDGNLSLKINNELILITPQGSHKGTLKEEDFVLVDINGNTISNGNKQPSSEIDTHLEVYEKRKDISAFIHCHPPTVVSLTIAGIPINFPIVPDVVLSLGEIPTLSYPGQDKKTEAELTVNCLEKHDVMVLEKHGAVTIGKNIFNALYKMELLEHQCKIIHTARVLGEMKTLNKKEIKELGDLRQEPNLFQEHYDPCTLKSVFTKLFNSDSPVFQRVLDLTNELINLTVSQTSYAQKLSIEEKENLSRELTASLINIFLGRFTGKK